MTSKMYVCPKTKAPLTETLEGLVRDRNVIFPYLKNSIPNFLVEQSVGSGSKTSLDMYNQDTSVTIYRNFLDWLFETFNQDETLFRKSILDKLQLEKGAKVLVTGSGLGEDLPYILEKIGSTGQLFAQDLAAAMVITAQSNLKAENVFFSVGNAQELPFADCYFDRVFHFGGINLFDDVGKSILEMNRVTATGGRVVFGDEGMAPWLKNTEIGRMIACNNPLWDTAAPLALLPKTCVDVHLSWVLGNCFYLIDFEVSNQGPAMNIDVHHQGRRGGSMRTRFYGQLEGVTPETKKKVIEAAAKSGLSVHDWLEKTIHKAIY